MFRKMLIGLVALAMTMSAAADDGMWMPQQIPALGDELKKLGLKMDPKQLADLTGFPMGAIVSLGGCSASFVSPEGLVATNHHCVAGALQYNSTKQNDILKNGFLAKTKAEEIQALPDARIFVTTAIEDVTSQVLGAIPAETNDAERDRLVTRRRREIINACEQGGGKRCLVSSFFEGGQYLKLTQMEIRDVRLVYAPALGVGNYGDEVDNWMWPRHTGDFGFYRAYVGKDGKPADFSKENVPYKPKHWLKISTRDLNENDLVMVVGTPGTTSRHATPSEFQDALEYELPTSVRYRTMLRDALQERGKTSREVALANASRIASYENYLKKHTGTLEAFERDDILNERQSLERRDRRALDETLGKSYDTASAELEKLLAEQRTTRERDMLFTWLYTASPMLTQANNLYRLSVEKTKNDLDRAEDFTERNRKKLQQTLTRNRRNIEPGSDRAGLRLFLLEATKLPAAQRIPPIDAALAATGRSTPEAQVDALLDKIYASTRIGDKDAEEKMFGETTKQLEARNDSMLAFAASLRPFATQLDEAKAARAGAASRLRPVVLDALRAARGGRLYPDANGTLRVGFGQVKGYAPRNAVWYDAQTDIRGVLEKNTGEEPFASPERLLERARKNEFGTYVDAQLRRLPVAFISTNVVTNGSSGSATLNAWGELCGLAFDSNWEGVGSDFFVEEGITRTIHVDSRYMLWVMDAVDDADNLLREMGITPLHWNASPTHCPYHTQRVLMPKRSRIKDFLWRHSAGLAFFVMVLFVAFLGYVGYTYVTITKKFESARIWDLPSRVYSDATQIVPGVGYPRSLLEPKLNHVGYHEVKGRVENPGEYRYVGDDLEIFLNNFEYPDMEFHAMPVLVEMDGARVRAVKRLTDNITLRGARIEPELITSIYDNEMEDRVPVSLGAVPKVLTDAIIATEDRSFYSHEGISIRGTLRALWTDIRTKSLAAGGSTLTQQLVKNLFLTAERTFTRKGQEALMAVLLELRYEKDEILETYLNEIYLGQNGSVQIVGVEQASQVYFGKKVTYLTLPQAATLAGMIRSPNVLSPLKYPQRAKDRRNVVLAGMRDLGKISEREYQEALAAPIGTTRFPKTSRSAPFFVDLVLKQLRETYPETQLKTEGLRIFTTLDTIMQRSAEEALDNGIANLSKKYKHIRNSQTPLEGVVLTIQPGTGYVKALVGGRNYSKTQFNRAIQARRQPGSLFKPFVYVTGMDPARGDQVLTASTVLDDSPISVQAGAAVWRPQNYDNRFHGRVTVREALAHSYNIPAVRAAIDAGVPNVIKTASNIGVESKLQPYPSVSLGSFEVTPLEIAYAYSVFANLGVKAEPVTILAVVTQDGEIKETREVKMKRVAPASVCYVMNDVLKDVFNYGTAGRARSLGFEHAYAGKTGTTNNYRDAWFIGYSPRILSLVWVGFDDGHSTRLAGGDACVPVWTRHMNRIDGLIADVDWKRPEDVSEREIDPSSGMLATPYCPQTRGEVYVAGTEPDAVCPLHAGSGEPSPFWPEPPPIFETDRRADAAPVPADPDAQRRAEEARKKAAQRENSMKRLLRRIFGGG